MPTSYARGNAVHRSWGRVVTLHGVHLMTVEDNVGYRARGHNYLLHDGSQTHNILRHNLAISTIRVSNMYRSDMVAASYLITHPTNDVIDNCAAGSGFYGFWY